MLLNSLNNTELPALAEYHLHRLVKVWNGELQVKMENLKELTLPLDQRASVKAICDRPRV